MRWFEVHDCSKSNWPRVEVQLCLDQEAFRLPDGAGLSVPLVEALLRTRLDETYRIPPTKQQSAERRLDPCESPRRNMETTSLSMWAALPSKRMPQQQIKGRLIVDQTLEVVTRADHEIVRTSGVGGTVLPPWVLSRTMGTGPTSAKRRKSGCKTQKTLPLLLLATPPASPHHRGRCNESPLQSL